MSYDIWQLEVAITIILNLGFLIVGCQFSFSDSNLNLGGCIET
ncbi:hypothetical protein [Xenorhabdus taiwanensis]